VPKAIVICGPNGAGKTSFARSLLPLLDPGIPFLNADEIQGATWRPVSAGRELLLRLSQMEEQRASFAVELTLSSRHTAKRMHGWADLGYDIVLHYIELPSADYAVERVRRRVEAGGHSVPEPHVRSRFRRSVVFFEQVFKPLADEWYHYYSDDQGVRLVAQHPQDQTA
jgi:predicted ABC-type ATPase